MLYAIILNNCPYSMAAKELLERNNNNYKIKMISQDEKHSYKTKEISSFPQIYLKSDNKKVLIGGYDTIKEIFDIINSNTKIKTMETKISKVKKLNKRQILRIIESFVSR